MIEINGGRVALRTMTREEYHAGRKRYVADPVMAAEPYAYDMQAVNEAYDRDVARGDAYVVLGIFAAAEHVGELSLKRIDREASRCEVGIMLYQDAYKEKGLGGTAFALAVDYAMKTLGLRAVYADTMGGNVRMQRILDRLGFRCYLRLEACYDMHGRWEDRLDYVLTREAWEKRRSSEG